MKGSLRYQGSAYEQDVGHLRFTDLKEPLLKA